MRPTTTARLALIGCGVLTLLACEAAPKKDKDQPDVPEGFTLARTLGIGSEAKLVGEPGYAVDVDDRVVVESATISGDGSTVWLTLYDEWADPSPLYTVVSMRSDGSDVRTSAVVRPADAPYFPSGFQVQTTEDGERGFLTQYTKDSQDRVVAQISVADRGEAFSVLTESDGEVEDLGLAQTVYTRVTPDGDAVMFTTGRHMWRANAGEGWVPFVAERVENLRWNGDEPPWNATFGGLDITASGGEWISNVWLGGDDDAFVAGTSIAVYGLEAVHTGGPYTAQIDDAGEVVSYSTFDPKGSWVGEQGGVHDFVDAPVGYAGSVALADSGSRFATVIVNGGTQASILEDVGGGNREPLLAPTWTTFGEMSEIVGEVSDDATVYLATNQGPVIAHPDVTAFGASVDWVYWRLDGEDLTVQVEVTAADPIQSVTVFPYIDGWMPPRLMYTWDEDPTYDNRFGVALEAVDGMSGTYEGVLHIRQDATMPLDERYSFIAIVGQGPEGSNKVTSTGYQRFDLFE